jgi:non-heme chloroperoxidase
MHMPQPHRAQAGAFLSLEYARQGSRAELPLVCLHGFTDSYRSFGPLFEALPAEVHAIAVSHRGHGGSDRPQGPYTIPTMARDLARLLSGLGIEKAVLVGHCMGGFVAQRFAVEYPGRTAGLVLINTAATVSDHPAIAELMAGLDGETIDPDFVREFQEGTIARPVPDDFMDIVVAESLRLPPWAWHRVLGEISQEDLTADLHRIDAPTRLIWGDRDVLFELAHQNALRTGIRGAQLEVMPGYGHSPHWEDPAAVAASIMRFVRKLDRDISVLVTQE